MVPRAIKGTDHNGRADSIWTVFSADSGYGGGAHAVTTPKYPGQGNARNDTADVVYRYTKLGDVDSLLLPRIGVAVSGDYSSRGWLDSITAPQSGGVAVTVSPRGDEAREARRRGVRGRASQSEAEGC